MLTRPRPRFGPAVYPAAVGVAILVSLAALTGCSAESPTAPTRPAATPTYHPATPAPASDADVEAAIASYLAYVEAGNAVDLADPTTIDAALAFTGGAQREFEENFYANLAKQGWHIAGSSSVTRVAPSALQPEGGADVVVLDVCVNNEKVDFLDAEGEHRVPPGLRAHQTVRATMTRAEVTTPTLDSPTWLVTATTPIESDQSCSGSDA
jgi:hypothetical protein